MFSSNDFKYNYKKTIWTSGNKARVDMNITGWGKINDLTYVITEHDTLKEYYEKETIVKEVNKSGLFLSGNFDSNKNYGAGLDWVIKNKVIIGTDIKYDRMIEQPLLAIKRKRG